MKLTRVHISRKKKKKKDFYKKCIFEVSQPSEIERDAATSCVFSPPTLTFSPDSELSISPLLLTLSAPFARFEYFQSFQIILLLSSLPMQLLFPAVSV